MLKALMEPAAALATYGKFPVCKEVIGDAEMYPPIFSSEPIEKGLPCSCVNAPLAATESLETSVLINRKDLENKAFEHCQFEWGQAQQISLLSLQRQVPERAKRISSHWRMALGRRGERWR
jgi:hypothetical protein